MKTPITAREMTEANLDGDPMTGFEQQTAFDGTTTHRLDLILGKDGDALSSSQALHRFDGNPMQRRGDDPHGAKATQERLDEIRRNEIARQAAYARSLLDAVKKSDPELTLDPIAERVERDPRPPAERVERRASRLPSPYAPPDPFAAPRPR